MEKKSVHQVTILIYNFFLHCVTSGKSVASRKGCKAKSPYWSYVYEPPFKTEGKILPSVTTRKYWEERLQIDLDGCYEEIERKIKPLLPDILKRKDLTKCERRILESWLD